MADDSNTFAVKERVNHYMYGLGTITEIDHQHTVIEFDESGRRKFVTSMLRLEHSTAAPPEPPAKKRKSRAKKPKATAKN